MILEEFDEAGIAVINPWDIYEPIEGMPKVAVSCYSYTTFDRMVKDLEARYFAEAKNANGSKPIYKASYKGTEVALFMMDVCASASVGLLEDVFQLGIEKVVVFGTCGVLDKSIADCSLIIPNRAVRDEGSSYHYAPPGDEIAVNEKHLEQMKGLFDRLKVSYTVGKTWTTDAFYRETPDKVKRRKEQGCICVDMECSANAAVAKFRGKELLQFFYAADNLDAEAWDVRSLSNHAKLEEKDRIALLALELAVG